MTLTYADPSAIARAYLVDEPDHEELRAALLESGDLIVTSEIARLELASAVRAAGHTGRRRRWRELLARIDADLDPEGPVTPLALRPEIVFEPARKLIVEQRLRTLDAIHLAVALEECPALADGDDIVFVTRDKQQTAAASAVGLAVR